MQQPLAVSSLSKRFGTHQAVKEVSFSVQAGEVVGIIGPNGAGKTTTIKMVLGLLHADGGSVEIFGSSASDPSVRARIGYMPETPSFYSNLTGSELLEFAGSLFGLRRPQIKERAGNLLERVGLGEAAGRRIGSYSKGMLQRVCLAQALINKPDLLFLDEPLDGLDPLGRIRMKELLLEIKKEGTAIVLNSHILSDVEIMSDRIAIMDRGAILALEPVRDLVPKGKRLEEVFIETIERHE